MQHRARVALGCWAAAVACARPAPAVELELPAGELRVGPLLLEATARLAADRTADSAAVLYVDVRARNLGDEAADAPRRLAPTLRVNVASCVIEVRLATLAAPSAVVWRHGDLAYPCPSQSWGHTLAPGGGWVSLPGRAERVPLAALTGAGLPAGRYLVSASLVLGLSTGEMHPPPPGLERARWSPDPGLRCTWMCTVTVPAGVLHIRR